MPIKKLIVQGANYSLCLFCRGYKCFERNFMARNVEMDWDNFYFRLQWSSWMMA